MIDTSYTLPFKTLQKEIPNKLNLLADKLYTDTNIDKDTIINTRVNEYFKFRLIFADEYRDALELSPDD